MTRKEMRKIDARLKVLFSRMKAAEQARKYFLAATIKESIELRYRQLKDR